MRIAKKKLMKKMYESINPYIIKELQLVAIKKWWAVPDTYLVGMFGIDSEGKNYLLKYQEEILHLDDPTDRTVKTLNDFFERKCIGLTPKKVMICEQNYTDIVTKTGLHRAKRCIVVDYWMDYEDKGKIILTCEKKNICNHNIRCWLENEDKGKLLVPKYMIAIDCDMIDMINVFWGCKSFALPNQSKE